MPGVKRLLFLSVLAFCFAQTTFAYASPGRPDGFVTDFAGILSPFEEAGLEGRLGDLESTLGAEVAIVTVQSLEGDTVENFAVKLFEEWGVGKKKDDNGILFLIAPNDREARIEVGYGLEPLVTDAAASFIMRKVIIPEFSAGAYYAGVDKGSDAIIKLIEGDPEFTASVSADQSPSTTSPEFAMGSIIPLIFLALFLFLWVRGIVAGVKGGWTPRGRGGWGGGSSGGFGGFSGGSSGGSSFGGGGSGGGGASGRW
jgi:uncharacterized protein